MTPEPIDFEQFKEMLAREADEPVFAESWEDLIEWIVVRMQPDIDDA